MDTPLADFLAFDTDRMGDATAALSFLERTYPFVGIGLYRVVFALHRCVIKFPLSEAGEYCNDGEGSWRDPIFARGRRLHWRGFVCVMQETLQPATAKDLIRHQGPEYDWIASIDCAQVGYDRHGTLKAYDFVHP